MGINAGRDVALASSLMSDDGIKRRKESGSLFLLELGDSPLGLIRLASLAESLRLLWMKIHFALLNRPLDFPRGDGGAVLPRMQNPEFHLAPTDVGTTQYLDAGFFKTRHFPPPRLMRALARILKRREVERIVFFLPLVEALTWDVKVTTRERRTLCFPEMIHPGKALFRLFAKRWYAGEVARPRQDG